MKLTRDSYFSHQRRQSNAGSNISTNGQYPSSPSASSSSFPALSTNRNTNKIRGIHINISSDPFQHRIPPYLQRMWQESQWKQYATRIHRMGRRYYAGTRLKQMIGVGMVMAACICVVLLLHVGFFSGKKYQDWERQGHNHLLGDRDMEEYMDEVDLLDNVYPDAGKGLTALILVLPPPPPPSASTTTNSDPAADVLHSILPLLASFCDYDLFGQVLLWNNHYPQVNLSMNHLQHPDILAKHHCPSSKIVIHNASTDLKSTARYIACTMAKTPYCYFYDPILTTTNKQQQTLHLRSVYANFLRSPTWVHGETVNRAQYTATQWTWCFWYDSGLSDENHDNVHLHTCYATPGTGMFVTKEMASTFLHQMELDPIDPGFADIYFTLWMNQGSAYLLQGSSSSPTSMALTKIEMDHLQHGLRTLYNSLKNRNGIFSSSTGSPLAYQHGGIQGDLEQQSKRHARTACHDDRCLFLTNVASLPNVALITYQPTSTKTTVQDSIRLHSDYYMDNSSKAGLMARYTYDHVVDGYDDTAWMSPEYIRKGDYIGLDLLMPVRIPLQYRILVDHPYLYRRAIQYQMSYDGALWIDLRSPVVKCVSLDQHVPDNNGNGGKEKVTLLECRFLVTETGYRFLRLVTLHDLDYRYMVYDFSFGAKVKRDKEGRFLDTERDDGLAFVDN